MFQELPCQLGRKRALNVGSHSGQELSKRNKVVCVTIRAGSLVERACRWPLKEFETALNEGKDKTNKQRARKTHQTSVTALLWRETTNSII